MRRAAARPVAPEERDGAGQHLLPELRAALASAQLRRAELAGALCEEAAHEQAAVHEKVSPRRRRPSSPSPARRQVSNGGKRAKRCSHRPVQWKAWTLGRKPRHTSRHKMVAPATPHGDGEHHNLKVKMNVALPADIIREHIPPYLPAVDILRSRVLGTTWNHAYLQVHPPTLPQVQPTRGGSRPVGFLLRTDQGQSNATRGTAILRCFRKLNYSFPERDAKVVTTSGGLYCVYLKHPIELLVTNFLDHVLINLNLPLQEEDARCVGMATFPLEGVEIAEYLVVIPFRPAYLNQGEDDIPRIWFMIWGSQGRNWDNLLHAQQWLNHPEVLALQSWNPKNIVHIGTAIYFHLSENDFICFDLEEGQAGDMDLPVHLLETQEKALSTWRGELCFLNLVSTDVQVHVLRENQWVDVYVIQLLDCIERYRPVFRSLTMALRNRGVETPEEAMVGATVVGYAEPDWLLLNQRGGGGGCFIILNQQLMRERNKDGRPRRIRLQDARGNFFLSHCSSLIRAF